MPAYTKTVWVNGTTPAINATNLNKIEQGIADAVRKDGSEAMTAQLITVAGSAGTPAIAPTGDSNTGIFFPAADTIAFGEGGAEAMRINSSGQVGIGTTTPTALTSMHGAPQATSGAILTLRDTTATGSNTTYGAISFISSPGTDFSIGKASENTTSALAFRNANTGAEFMRITSGGNVGIGTTSIPSVFGTTVKVAGSSGGTVEISATNVNLRQFASDGLSLAGVGTSTNHSLQLFTNDTERMRITSGGNVGIGTTNTNLGSYGATAKVVTVLSSTGFGVHELASGVTPADSNVLGVVSFINNGSGIITPVGTQIVGFQSGSHASYAGGKLIFYTRANGSTSLSERLTITDSGNVGIGTTSPSKQLHVKSGTAEILRLETTVARGSGSNFIQFNDASGSKGFVGYGNTNDIFYLSNDLNQSLTLRTNATERVFITGAGNVGIGTTSPDTLLHIKHSSQPTITFEDSSANKGYLDFNSTRMQMHGGSGSIYFVAGTSERMRLTSSGYLLIGYTSSNGAYPLQVNGQIFATSSTIATSDGRYKKDVVALDGALDIVKALNPVQFNWKDHPVHKFNTDVPTVGFIAQEVEQALADKSYLTSIIKKSECSWETETGETIEREVTRDVEKQVTREVEREVTETIDGEEVTRTVTEEITETVIEQVTEIVTEPVKETHTEEFLGIAESNLIAILTKAVKELAAEVEALKARI